MHVSLVGKLFGTEGLLGKKHKLKVSNLVGKLFENWRKLRGYLAKRNKI